MTPEVSPVAPDVRLLDLAEHNAPFKEPLLQAFEQIIDSGGFILGPHVEAFERKLADYCGVRHAVGLTSGTDALLVALMAIGVGPGDEVITTPFTWFSTASCIERLGAKPVFVDVIPRTYNIQVDDIEGVITPRTKAILPVHLFGLPASMNPIRELAEKHGIHVIEDAAQAIGGKYHGQPIGGLGDIGCFSFYPTKNLSAFGDAGAVVTDNDELADKLRSLRNHGVDLSGPTGYHFPDIGGNFRMSAFQGAALSLKIDHIDEWTRLRRQHAKVYSHALEALPVTTPFQPDTRYHVFHQYTIRVRGGQRDAVMHHLKACHVESRVFYAKPLHLQPCFAHYGHKARQFPEAEKAANEVLSLPVSPELTETQQQRVIEAIREFFRAE